MRRIQGDFTEAFQYLKWAYKRDGERLFYKGMNGNDLD